jgi:hypothetical protein
MPKAKRGSSPLIEEIGEIRNSGNKPCFAIGPVWYPDTTNRKTVFSGHKFFYRSRSRLDLNFFISHISGAKTLHTHSRKKEAIPKNLPFTKSISVLDCLAAPHPPEGHPPCSNQQQAEGSGTGEP